MTRGRTRPLGAKLDLVTILVRTGRKPGEHLRLSPEQRQHASSWRRRLDVALDRAQDPGRENGVAVAVDFGGAADSSF